MSAGKRLDSVLHALGLARSRNQAQQLIRAGAVLVNGVPELRVGKLVSDSSRIEVTQKSLPVSRAGLKLEHAFETFELHHSTEQIAVDIGAATGGFTQVLLGHGFPLVLSVDVGTGQLAAELRANPRVISLESTDARDLTREAITQLVLERNESNPELFLSLPEASVGVVTIDVSFISLRYLLPTLAKQFSAAQIIALFKPQFEVGKDALGKNGVVSAASHIATALKRFETELTSHGGIIIGVSPSPILGLHGNKEFLLWITMQTTDHDGELRQLPSDWMVRAIAGETLIRG